MISSDVIIGSLLYSFVSILCLLLVILIFWFSLWKLVLSKNPIVKDFFDIKDNKDQKKQ